MAPSTLLDILSNEYLLLATTPYLLPTELLALGQCSRSYYSLIIHSRSVWRHLNLSVSPRAPPVNTTAIAQRTHIPLYQTEAELSRLLYKPSVLRDVQTLILDGLPVTIDLLSDLLGSARFRIQLLSIRGCNLIDERQLASLFQYLVRATRGNLALKGCYRFGDMDYPGGIFPSANKPRAHNAKGRFMNPGKLGVTHDDWVTTLKACEGIIAFDTRLCTSPRHEEGDQHYVGPTIANIRLAGSCAECGTSPEAQTRYGLHGLPRVVCAPVPLTTSDIRVACRSVDRKEDDILRCESCAKDRWCEQCGKWWCDSCVAKNQQKKFVSLDCYECGALCADCTRCTSRTCKNCRGEYCIMHNTGADDKWCEWCKSPGGIRLRQREAATQGQHIPPPPILHHTNTMPQRARSVAEQYTQQQRARTIARLNAIRSSLGVGRFRGESGARNRYSLSVLSL